MIHALIETLVKALLGVIVTEFASCILRRIFSMSGERLTGLQPGHT